LFGILLLVSQIVQGGMVASVPCADDFNEFTVSTTSHDCAGATDAARMDSPPNHAPTHCKRCDSGACRITNAPALAILPGAVIDTLHPRLEAPQPCLGPFKKPFDKILRPPK
jgi:hypothetical protein